MDLCAAIGIGCFFTVRAWWEVKARVLRHKENKSTKKQDGDTYLAIIFFSALCFVVGFIDWNQGFPISLKVPYYLEMVGVIGTLLSAIYINYVHSHLSSNWTPTIKQLTNHSLTKSGPYKLLRHPMYTAIGMFLLSAFLCTSNLGFLAAFAYSLILSLYRIPKEEALLRQIFKKEHEIYCKSGSYKLIPYIW